MHHLLAERDFNRRMKEPTRGKMLVLGLPCAPSLAIGNIVLWEPADLQSTPDRNAQDIESEVQIFQAAVIAAKNELHSDEEQYRLYRDLLQFFAPKPVTIRTLDTGGGKNLPSKTQKWNCI
ncbi:MAG: hypothetical protein P8X55_00780 [Desulfosarcinaceae bacterium]